MGALRPVRALGGSDIELVTLAKAAQDDRAFSELVRRHQARLRAFLNRLGAGADTDDMAQTTFIKAHRGLATFESGRSFRSWLFAIAYREFLQQKRKDRAAGRLQDALAGEPGFTGDSSLQESMSLDLQTALAGLEVSERACLLLCDAAGFTHAEAAAALDTPLGSVKTYIQRGREKMRDALASETPADRET